MHNWAQFFTRPVDQWQINNINVNLVLIGTKPTINLIRNWMVRGSPRGLVVSRSNITCNIPNLVLVSFQKCLR